MPDDSQTKIINEALKLSAEHTKKSAAEMVELKKKAEKDAIQRKTAAINPPSKPYQEQTVSKLISSNTAPNVPVTGLNGAYDIYRNKLSEYDYTKSVVRAIYTKRDIWTIFSPLSTPWKAIKNRLWVVADKKPKELEDYEKAFANLEQLKKDKKPAAAVTQAETDLKAAEAALAEKIKNDLDLKRAEKKQALEALKTQNPDSDIVKILTELQGLDDKVFELEQKQAGNHQQAMTDVADWLKKGDYIEEHPSFIDLSKTPGHQALYNMRVKTKEDTQKILNELSDTKRKLYKQDRDIDLQLDKLKTSSKTKDVKEAEEKLLKQAKPHIAAQMREIDQTAERVKKSIIEQDEVVEKALQQKFEKDEKAYQKVKTFTEKASEFFTQYPDTKKTKLKITGLNALPLAFVASNIGLAAAGFATLSLVAPPLSLGLAAIPLALYVTWTLGNMSVYGCKVLWSKKDADTFIDEHGKHVLMARIGTNAYVARTVDDSGQATGMSAAYTGFKLFQTAADRRLLVASFVEGFIKAGIVKAPGGTLVMTCIPDDHYDEYCALLIIECKRYGISIEGPAIEKKLKENEAPAKEKAFNLAQEKAQHRVHEEKERYKTLPGMKQYSPEEQKNITTFHHAVKAGELSGVMKYVDVLDVAGKKLPPTHTQRPVLTQVGNGSLPSSSSPPPVNNNQPLTTSTTPAQPLKIK